MMDGAIPVNYRNFGRTEGWLCIPWFPKSGFHQRQIVAKADSDWPE
jgi:hypothetical protein